MGFYSFLLGVETKKLIELKEIQDITKENSKRAMFADSLKIVTKGDDVRIFYTQTRYTMLIRYIEILFQQHVQA